VKGADQKVTRAMAGSLLVGDTLKPEVAENLSHGFVQSVRRRENETEAMMMTMKALTLTKVATLKVKIVTKKTLAFLKSNLSFLGGGALYYPHPVSHKFGRLRFLILVNIKVIYKSMSVDPPTKYWVQCKRHQQTGFDVYANEIVCDQQIVFPLICKMCREQLDWTLEQHIAHSLMLNRRRSDWWDRWKEGPR